MKEKVDKKNLSSIFIERKREKNDGRREREVVLPAGIWIDDYGQKFKGGKTYTIKVPLDRIPYFSLEKRNSLTK